MLRQTLGGEGVAAVRAARQPALFGEPLLDLGEAVGVERLMDGPDTEFALRSRDDDGPPLGAHSRNGRADDDAGGDIDA